MTICALFLCAASVYSKQTPVEIRPAPISDAYALKNPNAFDPARRRSVRAMKVPRETVARMASGLDAAEADTPAVADAEAAPGNAPRVAAIVTP